MVNYRFVIHQLSPEQRDYHFMVHIDVELFRAECMRRGIAPTFIDPFAPARKAWQDVVYTAAVNSILDQFVLKWMFRFAPRGRFYRCETHEPFQWATSAHDGFQLVIMDSWEAGAA
jgi:hypothetical protein